MFHHTGIRNSKQELHTSVRKQKISCSTNSVETSSAENSNLKHRLVALFMNETSHLFETCHFGTTPYGTEEHQKVAQLLSEPLTRDDVQTRPGPSRLPLTYISGFKAIDKANKVFGFDGWSSQIMGFDMIYNKENSQGKHTCCFTVRLRVTLKNGAFREDVGVGFAESYKEGML